MAEDLSKAKRTREACDVHFVVQEPVWCTGAHTLSLTRTETPSPLFARVVAQGADMRAHTCAHARRPACLQDSQACQKAERGWQAEQPIVIQRWFVTVPSAKP